MVTGSCGHATCSTLSCALTTATKFWRRHNANVVALIFLVTGLILNTIVLAITHERVPLQMRILPDLLFDFTDYYYSAFTFSELYISAQNITFFLLLLFHPDREIIARRFMLIVGIVYYLRTVTFTSTSLPTPFKAEACLPKLSSNLTLLEFTYSVFGRAYNHSLGLGMVSQQEYSLCGDYIYSGHTSIIIMVYLFINTYFFMGEQKSKLLEFVEYVHLCLTVAAILCVFISRQHYSVDVILAYYVCTRLFWTYHSLCMERVMSNELRRRYEEEPSNSFAATDEEASKGKQMKKATALMIRDDQNLISQVWWWSIFVYLEITKRPPDGTIKDLHQIQFCIFSCRSATGASAKSATERMANTKSSAKKGHKSEH